MRKTPVKDVVRKLLKPRRAAEALDCSVRYVYGLGDRGELEFVHEGRSTFVVAESLDKYVERLREKAAAVRTEAKPELAEVHHHHETSSTLPNAGRKNNPCLEEEK